MFLMVANLSFTPVLTKICITEPFNLPPLQVPRVPRVTTWNTLASTFQNSNSLSQTGPVVDTYGQKLIEDILAVYTPIGPLPAIPESKPTWRFTALSLGRHHIRNRHRTADVQLPHFLWYWYLHVMFLVWDAETLVHFKIRLVLSSGRSQLRKDS
ncbi:hypothetical protein DEU56DRAFT_931591 [Suillus clintonianus]|uniref:uncharacterized protein n=1 Tax=Suillus clintonianus TaxID=1904413 RepID=UPI001B865310|nr:uncharacterized protein DEU56DRAFT_931591 [Suillus clintonianus]KAG2116934.1 hypothetical protein DEU56DRAFT_931591 [Suillus clintonianus]